MEEGSANTASMMTDVLSHEIQLHRIGAPQPPETLSISEQSQHSNNSSKKNFHILVLFDEGDSANPKNWSKRRKRWCTMIVALICFCVAFNSAVITSDLEGVAITFEVSEEVALLTVTVFVIGFGIGPMLFPPLSELVGRRIVYATTLLIAVIFIIPCGVAGKYGTSIATGATC